MKLLKKSELLNEWEIIVWVLLVSDWRGGLVVGTQKGASFYEKS